MEKLIRQIRNKHQSVVTKIILITICIILPINIQLIWTTKSSIEILNKQVEAANENTLKLYLNQLDLELNAIDDYFYDLAADNVYFNILMNETSGDNYVLAKSNLVHNYLKKVFNSKPEAYFAVTKGGDDVLLAAEREMDEQTNEIREYLSKLFDTEMSGDWHLKTISGHQYIVRIVTYKGLKAGALIRAETIFQDVHKLKGFEHTPLALTNKEKHVEIKKGDLLVTSKSSEKQIYLSAILPEKDVLNKLPFIQVLNYNISIGLLLVIPFLLFVLRKILIKPLLRINKTINYIEEGNLDYRIVPYKTSYEFQRINNALNNMIEQISHLTIENYEKELQKQRIENRNLRLQVRPHFLFNSFNLIFNMAQLKDFTGIQKMISYLTRYFRYGLRGGSDLETIEDEINFVKEYLNIAEMRFPDCFIVNYEIEEEALKQLIPSLIIHNFVENIIQHTLKIGTVIQITIEVISVDKYIHIFVRDNGNGIKEDILQLIQAEEMVIKDNENHIGIWNSIKRLKLFYGSDAKLIVESEINMGTKVTIIIPKRGDEPDEFIDYG